MTVFTSLSKDMARLEAKLDQAIMQAASDRTVTQSHIAECNVRNKRVDDNDQNSRNEWAMFKAETLVEMKNLNKTVVATQVRLATLIGLVAGGAWLIDHFHLFHS